MCRAIRHVHCRRSLRSTDGSHVVLSLTAVLMEGQQQLCCNQPHHLPLLTLLLASQQHPHQALRTHARLS